MSTPGIENLQSVLDLNQVSETEFVGTTGPCPWPKAYGGDMVAQAMVAAMRTTGDDRELHSMHSYFMRPVDIGAEVHYAVEVLRDGRGYSTREVRAAQNGRIAYICLASFHTGEDGPVRDATDSSTTEVDPESLPSTADVLADVEPGSEQAGTMTEGVKDYYSTGRSADMRHHPGPIYTKVVGGNEPTQDVWVRTFQPLERAAKGLTLDQTHQAALAWMCDFTIIEPSLRSIDLPWATPGLMTASLDHAMWFHNPARVDDWLRYRQESASVEHGRALGLGHFHTRDGRLVATVAQEASLRQGK